jgi:hypothetical protein
MADTLPPLSVWTDWCSICGEHMDKDGRDCSACAEWLEWTRGHYPQWTEERGRGYVRMERIRRLGKCTCGKCWACKRQKERE